MVVADHGILIKCDTSCLSVNRAARARLFVELSDVHGLIDVHGSPSVRQTCAPVRPATSFHFIMVVKGPFYYGRELWDVLGLH